jgi:hypothetical protein
VVHGFRGVDDLLLNRRQRLLDIVFGATAPGIPAGTVALNATRHRRLGSSPSPQAPFSSTPLEQWCTGRGKNSPSGSGLRKRLFQMGFIGGC